jgi:hypothetical protein
VGLPHADAAVLDRAKLVDYLLSPTHAVGRFKARFFNRRGFVAERWTEVEAALRDQHLSQEDEPGRLEPHGQLFTIRAILTGPAGESTVVLSVWFLPAGSSLPRFVTAHPGGAK